jgi:hypothetical protein
VLGGHILGRPLGRLIDHDNPAEEDEDLQPYQLHITCKPKNEPHIRALIVNNTTDTDIILRGVNTTRTDDGTETKLTAYLLLDGDAATHLEQLVARLSLEPGIHAVHWHTADDPALWPSQRQRQCRQQAPPDRTARTSQRDAVSAQIDRSHSLRLAHRPATLLDQATRR